MLNIVSINDESVKIKYNVDYFSEYRAQIVTATARSITRECMNAMNVEMIYNVRSPLVKTARQIFLH